MHSTLPTPITHSRSALERAIREATLALARVVELRLDAGMSFAQRETTILEAGNEVCRRLMVGDLQRLADSFPDEIRVGGLAYRRHQQGTVAYHSLCGDVVITRDSYRQKDIRNGPTIIPLDLEAGLIDAATPALAFSVADGIAELPSRTYEGLLRAAGRHPPSRSTVERLSKYVGGGMKRDIVALEEAVRTEEGLPDGAHAISIGLDRTTVPMAEERPLTQAPTSRRKKRTKPRVRRAPHPIDVCYRMAYVGTVAVVDSHGDA